MKEDIGMGSGIVESNQVPAIWKLLSQQRWLRQAATPLLAPPSKPVAAARRAARVPIRQKKDETDVAEVGRCVGCKRF